MKTKTITRRIGHDCVVDGRDVCIEFTRHVEAHREMYGADADGNRGMLMTMVDDDRADNVTVYDYALDVQFLLSSLCEEKATAVRAAIDAYLEANDPLEDDGSDGPDEDAAYDRMVEEDL